MGLEIGGIGLTFQKPQQFVDDRLEVQFFGRHQRKTFAEIEPHLVAEHRFRARTGAVGFTDAVVADMPHQIKISFHSAILCASSLAR
jgi:hypothetical protein